MSIVVQGHFAPAIPAGWDNLPGRTNLHRVVRDKANRLFLAAPDDGIDRWPLVITTAGFGGWVADYEHIGGKWVEV